MVRARRYRRWKQSETPVSPVQTRPRDHDAAIAIVRDYIDSYGNPKRRHSFINYECPIQFELKCQLAAMAA